MNKDLKPCPFCGGDDIHYVCNFPTGFFSCQECKADGPLLPRNVLWNSEEEKMQEAKNWWNGRI